MELITVKEAAKKWGVTPRRVQILCSEGKIKGIQRFGRIWMIPSHAVLPSSKKGEEPHLPMPKKSPFLDMTNIYNKAGEVNKCADMLVNNPEAHLLFESLICYRRGEIDKVYDNARFFLNSKSGFYAILGGGMLLALCAIWRGDFNLWKEAKKHICDAPTKNKEDRDIVSLALAIVDSSIYNNDDYPEWFKKGNFEILPADSHPAAKVFYIKYLYMTAYGIASKQYKLEGIEGLALMKIIPFTIEPLITQAVVDKTIITEIYLRMSCAVAYYLSGKKEEAITHIDRAIDLSLPDGLYGLLTEYIRHFDGLLEERIALKNPAVIEVINELYRKYSIGWAKLSNKLKNKYIATNLTKREHEVAKLTVFGYTIKEIAAMLYISESTVKQTISRVINKTGINDKSEFTYII